MPFINEAVYALRDGVAEPHAIDTVAKLGFGHPIGPLALADLIGLDTCVAIMEVLRNGPRRREVRAVPAARRARAGPVGSAASRAAASTRTSEPARRPAPPRAAPRARSARAVPRRTTSSPSE